MPSLQGPTSAVMAYLRALKASTDSRLQRVTVSVVLLCSCWQQWVQCRADPMSRVPSAGACSSRQPTLGCLRRSLPALRISQNEPTTGGRPLSSTLAQQLIEWTQLKLHCEFFARMLSPQHGAAPLIAGCLTYRLVNTACDVSISMINVGRQLSDMPEVSQGRVTTMP